MPTILDDIIAHKRTEIASLRPHFAHWSPPGEPPVRRDFRTALLAPGISLIAEFKRRSPSKGVIRADLDPVFVARAYQEAGASAVSVLTDDRFFGGSLPDLCTVRDAVALPVLRKDFIIDAVQIAQSCTPDGPDCLLLIAAALPPERLRALRETAASCGFVCLVEVHNEAELHVALDSGADIIGINNRDLNTFQVSLDTTLSLRPHVPGGVPVVAESGIHTRQDVLRLQDAGVHAMLVGEALMAADDPRAKVRELLGES